MPQVETHSVLWWSPSGREYSRNRIVRDAFTRLGWTTVDFSPRISALGDLQASLHNLQSPRLVWVPCFRQRDVAAAVRWARRRRVPLVFDPLISAYDKQVFERGKFAADSWRGCRLLAWETQRMRAASLVVADTHCHADYFCEQFGLSRDRVRVIPVGAEESVFVPQGPSQCGERLRVLFYGSFIGLQGPEVIVEAARRVPEVDWTLIGDGPLNAECRRQAEGMAHVTFIPWIPYEQLPQEIGAADILLGVFGGSRKAGRVIPNKVYQALASMRPVVTLRSPAYPEGLQAEPETESGIVWTEPGSAESLAAAVSSLARRSNQLSVIAKKARHSYDRWFSQEAVVEALRQVLGAVLPDGSS